MTRPAHADPITRALIAAARAFLAELEDQSTPAALEAQQPPTAPPERDCEYCGKRLAIRPGERKSAFRRRRTCNTSCSGRLAWKIHRARKAAGEQRPPAAEVAARARNCATCKKRLRRRPDETPSAFARRETCSRTCGHQLASARRRAGSGRPPIDTSDRVCAICGETFSKRPRESDAQYAARQTCSRSCGQRLRNQNRRKATPPQATEPQQHNSIWSEAENDIIRATYPLEGGEATLEALTAAGYHRTEAATRQQAARLGIKGNRAHARRRSRADAWTDAELAIITRTYPLHGLKASVEALAEAGYTRTAGATSSRQVGRLALTRDASPEAAQQNVLDLIRDYRGMPLNVRDLHEELRIPIPALLRTILPALLERGVIANKHQPDDDDWGLDEDSPERLRDGQFYDPHAEQDEVAA